MLKNTSLVIFTLSSLIISTGILFAQYSSAHNIYWVYQKNNQGYKLSLKDASKEGIRVSKNRDITFKVLLTYSEYKNLKNKKGVFPLYAEWYRFNRAKKSIFSTEKIEINDFKTVEGKNGKKLYRLSITQKDILSGTWLLRVTSKQGKEIKFNNKSEFDIMIF